MAIDPKLITLQAWKRIYDDRKVIKEYIEHRKMSLMNKEQKIIRDLDDCTNDNGVKLLAIRNRMAELDQLMKEIEYQRDQYLNEVKNNVGHSE